MFRQQRTEDRGPIRRYKKVRPDRKGSARSPQSVASDADVGIGSGSSPPPTSSSTPKGTPIIPPSNQFRTALITAVPTTSRVRTSILVAVFALFIAGIAIPLISVGHTINSFNQGLQNAVPTPAGPHNGAGSKSAGGSKSITAPQHHYYLSAAGARAGLALISKKAPGARLSLVRLDATSISAVARLADGKSRLIVVEPTSGPLVESTPASPERSLPIKEIRPPVVGKLVAEMKTRFHVPASRIDYMVLNSSPGLPIHWILFTKAPSHPAFSASLNGEHLARLP